MRRESGILRAFYMGGHDPDRPTVGVMYIDREDIPERDRLTSFPGKGDLTLTFGRFDYACVTAADGSRWVLETPRRTLTAAARSPRGCA